MRFKRVPREMEERVTNVADSAVRKISRRDGLKHVFRGTTAALAGVTVGQLTGVKAANAIACTCSKPRGVWCSGCASNGCPSGYSICTTSSPCAPCIYSSGYWVSCTGLGSCGFGYRVCRDCWRNSSCSTTCGCLSTVLCSGCCSPAEVKADMARQEQLALAQ